MRALLVAVALSLVLSGCVAELLAPPATTVLSFACAVLDPVRAQAVVLESWGAMPGSPEAVAALRDELVRLTGRPAEAVTVRVQDEPEFPGAVADAAGVVAWGREHAFLEGDSVVFAILWLPSLGGNATGASGPGVVAVAADAAEALAGRLGRPPAEVARVLLLHHAGHALGLVNRGVPVQDPTIQDREGSPGHEPDPASVMNGGWEDARTASWSRNATYDRYSDGVAQDLQGAAAPDGVCE